MPGEITSKPESAKRYYELPAWALFNKVHLFSIIVELNGL